MTAGLLLAAGASRRFGEEPKQLARWRGRPLLAHALEAMAGFKRLVVVLGAHADRIRTEVPLDGADVVECSDWAEGQAASLRCGVAALGAMDAAVVGLADMPLVPAAAYARVAAHGDQAAARATYDGVPGHPVLLGRGLLDRVGELRGDVGFKLLLDEVRVLDVECGDLGDPVDIDTREDLEVLRT